MLEREGYRFHAEEKRQARREAEKRRNSDSASNKSDVTVSSDSNYSHCVYGSVSARSLQKMKHGKEIEKARRHTMDHGS